MSYAQNITRIGGAGRGQIVERAPAPRSRGNWFARAFSMLDRAWAAAVSRRDLAELDDRMLKDLGISRAQARFEASRQPWHLSAKDDASTR